MVKKSSAVPATFNEPATPISGPQVVIDGDSHINNFGLYETPQRNVVVDINDFDEATIGPWEWDLKRLVASVNVAGRENGLDAEERRSAVMRCVGGYSLNTQRLMKLGVLETWSLFAYAELERNEAVLKSVGIQIGNKFRAVVKKVLSKAQRTHSETLLAKVARRQANGGWRFVEAPPILTGLDNATRQKVISSLTEYGETLPPEYRNMLHRYSVADVCHRVVGVGSVGMRAYLVLLFGNGDADPLFLQVKEAVAPAHAPYLPPPPMRIQHEGRRVVGAQRLRPLKVATVLRFSESDTSEKGIDAPIGSVVGGTLGLLAFLLASTFGMAASRFDTRRQLLLDEVNAIGTCYLRADLVTQPERVEIRKRLREYVHLRAEAVKQPQTLPQVLARSETLHDELWSQALLVAKKDSNSEMHALFVDSLNEVIDFHAKRVVVGQYHIPDVIWLALYVVSMLSMTGVGYQFGRAGSRDFAISFCLALAFAIVIYLIADLDRVYEGTLQVSQQPMIGLDRKLGASAP